MRWAYLLSEAFPLPHGGRLIGTKWGFKRKGNVAGAIEDFRARLIALGFPQIFGLDYSGTFAPVARLSTLLLVYALSVLLALMLASLDAVVAMYPRVPILCRKGGCIDSRKALWAEAESKAVE